MSEPKKQFPQKGKERAAVIQVHCAHDRLVATAKLKPNPANPVRHGDHQIQLLAHIIRKSGWRNPIVVSKRSGLIVKGHGRFLAARLLNLEKVPVDFQDYASKKHEQADLIADNRVAELADKDFAAIKDMLQEMDAGDFDMDLTGYDGDAIENLLAALKGPEDEEESTEQGEGKTNECPKCGHKWKQ